MSSASSSSTSGCASPSSRSTSLSSETTEPILIPPTYVHIVSANPEFLSAVFDKHVGYEEHILGVITDNDNDVVTNFDANWHAQELMGIGYHVSSSLHGSYTTTSVCPQFLMVCRKSATDVLLVSSLYFTHKVITGCSGTEAYVRRSSLYTYSSHKQRNIYSTHRRAPGICL